MPASIALAKVAVLLKPGRRVELAISSDTNVRTPVDSREVRLTPTEFHLLQELGLRSLLIPTCCNGSGARCAGMKMNTCTSSSDAFAPNSVSIVKDLGPLRVYPA